MPYSLIPRTSGARIKQNDNYSAARITTWPLTTSTLSYQNPTVANPFILLAVRPAFGESPGWGKSSTPAIYRATAGEVETKMSKKAGPIPANKPSKRKVSVRGLVFALSGSEQPYDVYRFSGRAKFERPKHNPFKGL